MKEQLDLIIKTVKEILEILKRSKIEPIKTKKKVSVINNTHNDLYLNFQDDGDNGILVTIYPNKKYLNSELISEDKSLSVEFGHIYY